MGPFVLDAWRRGGGSEPIQRLGVTQQPVGQVLARRYEGEALHGLNGNGGSILWLQDMLE